MLSADPVERMTVEDALLTLSSLPPPPSLSAPPAEAEDTNVADAACPDGRKLTLAVRYVTGAATTLVVDDATSVGTFMRRALATFFPSRCDRLSASAIVTQCAVCVPA